MGRRSVRPFDESPCERPTTYRFWVPVLRLFAAAREAAATSSAPVEGRTVAEVLASASRTYGESFTAVLRTSQVWVNGEPAGDGDVVDDDDEVAVIPPVSGGTW